MRKRIRLLSIILEILIGGALIICGETNVLDNYWSGLGTSLVMVGAVFLFRYIRYHVDEEYQENVDVAREDERNKFLRMKAWSWAGYLSVIGGLVVSIILKGVGLSKYGAIVSIMSYAQLLLYWVSYMIVRKKY
ncbi:MAG: hypothetical protein E7447_01740 [Ruminococcaceae bacterium]|nr:hypothetical protein [Oscillospiraceae bacterium]